MADPHQVEHQLEDEVVGEDAFRMASQRSFQFRAFAPQLFREIAEHRNRRHLRLEQIRRVADARDLGVIRNVDRRPDARIVPEEVDHFFEQGIGVEHAFVVGVPVEFFREVLRIPLLVGAVAPHKVQHDEGALLLQRFRQQFEQRPVGPGAPEQEILHRVEPGPPFRSRGECRDRGVEPPPGILVAEKNRLIRTVVRYIEEARMKFLFRIFPVLVAGGQQHRENLHGLGVAGVGVAHENALRRIGGPAQKRRGVEFVPPGAGAEAAVRFADDQDINSVVAAAVLHEFRGFRPPRGGSVGIIFDHLEILETVREENLGPIQGFASGQFLPETRRRGEQRRRADGRHGVRRRIRISEPVEQDDPEYRGGGTYEQQRTGRIGEEVMYPLREIGLIDRLNRVGGEFAPRNDPPYQNRQRQQIQSSRNEDGRHCCRLSETARDEFSRRCVQAPAPARQQQRETELLRRVETVGRREIQCLLQRQHPRKREIDQPPRALSEQQLRTERGRKKQPARPEFPPGARFDVVPGRTVDVKYDCRRRSQRNGGTGEASPARKHFRYEPFH